MAEPGPNAICMRTGFKVKLSEIVRQWDGLLVHRRFADRRHPQEFVRGVRDNQSLPFASPESPDVFVGPGDVTADDL